MFESAYQAAWVLLLHGPDFDPSDDWNFDVVLDLKVMSLAKPQRSGCYAVGWSLRCLQGISSSSHHAHSIAGTPAHCQGAQARRRPLCLPSEVERGARLTRPPNAAGMSRFGVAMMRRGKWGGSFRG